MKKISISRDKKLTMYIIITSIFGQIALYFSFQGLETSLSESVINGMEILGHLAAIYLTMRILSETKLVVCFDEKKIKIGQIFAKSINYTDITNVEMKIYIEVYSKKNKGIKINIVDIEKNKIEYEKILQLISEKSGLSIDVKELLDVATETGRQAYKYEFSGLLKYINAYLILMLILNFSDIYTYFVKDVLEHGIDVLVSIAYSALILINICILYVFSRRYKHTNIILIFYFIIYFGISKFLIDKPNWLLTMVEKTDFSYFDNCSWTVHILFWVAFIITLCRYFKTAEGPKYIFINERLIK